VSTWEDSGHDWSHRVRVLLDGGIDLVSVDVFAHCLGDGAVQTDQQVAEALVVSATKQWLDAFRREHNHIRPHEAQGMQTPAIRWLPSPRRYNPDPPAWDYPKTPGH
jgi:hypothetical protein